MKTTHRTGTEGGSVLVTAMMTMTILAMICATSLYISSQNNGTGLQTAGWQQALTAAESGMDAAVRALNADASGGGSPWTNWKVVSTSTLPKAEPTNASTAASGPPTSSQYNLLPSSALTFSLPQTEGSDSVSAWVTIDTAAGNLTTTTPPTKQWYRIRATGKSIYRNNATLLTRVSNNRLDNDLRNSIAMNFNHKGADGTTVTATNGSNTLTGPTRTIEAIMTPTGGGGSIWGDGMVLKNALSMSGGGSMGHVDLSTLPVATFVANPTLYRSTDYTETVIAMLNANGSDLKNTSVYGGMAYSTSAAAPKNTSNVKGTISTPYGGSAPTVSNPTWTPDITYAAGSPPFTSIGPASTNKTINNPYKVKVTGNFTVPGGKSLAITQPNSGFTTYLEIWITGSFTTSGSGVINQDPKVHVTYYVDGSVTTSGGSFNNQTGLAQNNQMIVVGGGSVTVSGSGNYIGSILAPDSTMTVSGSGLFIGGLVANTLTISGGASVYVDDSLRDYTGGTNSSGSGAPAGYAFSSWFEDNSYPNRSSLDVNFTPHPIIY